MSSNSITVSRAAQGLRGTITVPGDKSISHRVAILGALGTGAMQVRNYLCSEDCVNTLRAMQQELISQEEAAIESEAALILQYGLR